MRAIASESLPHKQDGKMPRNLRKEKSKFFCILGFIWMFTSDLIMEFTGQRDRWIFDCLASASHEQRI